MNFTPNFTKTKERAGNPIEDVRYVPVSRYMVPEIVTFREDQPIHEVIDAMLRHKISGAPVLNEQNVLVGFISEKDCLRVLIDEGYYNNPLTDRCVRDYMTQGVNTIKAETDLLTVAKAFINTNYKKFPVVDWQGRLVGQISRCDVLKAACELHSTTWH